MTLSSPVRLSDQEKLEILQRLDQFRSWRFLDEQRYCLVCCQIITGRQIQVVGDSSGNGSVRLSCPTDGCNSIPKDWILPTDEVLGSAKAQTVPIEQPNSVVSDSADHVTTERVGPHWRKLAFHFNGLLWNDGLGSRPFIH